MDKLELAWLIVQSKAIPSRTQLPVRAENGTGMCAAWNTGAPGRLLWQTSSASLESSKLIVLWTIPLQFLECEMLLNPCEFEVWADTDTVLWGPLCQQRVEENEITPRRSKKVGSATDSAAAVAE